MVIKRGNDIALAKAFIIIFCLKRVFVEKGYKLNHQ